MDITIIKEYVTGAKIFRFKNAHGWESNFVKFDDCQECNGEGYHLTKKAYYSSRYEKTQCQSCALRHGSTEFYNPQIEYQEIADQVKREVKIKATGKLTKDEVATIENFQDSELARKYRKLLYNVWNWQEPQEINQKEVN